jgi:hypothetical protein
MHTCNDDRTINNQKPHPPPTSAVLVLFVNSRRSLTAVLQETTETMPDSCNASTRRSGNLLLLFLERGIAVEGETCENLRADLTRRPRPLTRSRTTTTTNYRGLLSLFVLLLLEQLHTPQQPSLQQQIAG